MGTKAVGIGAGMRFAAAAISVATALIAPIGVAGAQSQKESPRAMRLRLSIRRSLEALGHPEHRLEALRQLRNAGKLALPQIERALTWPNIDDLAPQQQRDLIYVIGRNGPDALGQFELLRALLRDGEPYLQRTLFAAFSRMASYLPEASAEQLLTVLRQEHASSRASDYYVLLKQLSLGSQPWTEKLVAAIGSVDTAAIAACRWVLAHQPTGDKRTAAVLAALRRRLEQAMHRDYAAFERGTVPEAPELATAYLAWSKQPLDAVAARALLRHDTPEKRQRGIAWLASHGKGLPTEQIADLVIVLWDSDEATACAAARALATLGTDGLVGLLPLDTCAREHASSRVRSTCARSATKLASSWLPADSWPAAVYAAARSPHDPPPLPARAASQAERSRIADMLLMARAGRPFERRAALAVAHAAGADERLAGAVYGWIAAYDPDITNLALAWLARNARVAHRMIAQTALDNVDDECARIERERIGYRSRSTAQEAFTWIRSAFDTEARRLRRLHEEQSRDITHALAELVRTDAGGLASETARLLELVRARGSRLALSYLIAFKRQQETGSGFGRGLPTRRLALLALAASGKMPTDDRQIAKHVQDHFGVTVVELSAQIGKERQSGKLDERIQRLEHECRLILGVDPELTWPSRGGEDSGGGEGR